jgi:Family of unknown function (DUF6343)
MLVRGPAHRFWFTAASAGIPIAVMSRPFPRQRTARPPGDDRTRWGAGGPPARSALGLRRVLAVFGLVFCGVMAGILAVAGWPLPAALLALLAAIAIVDLIVIQRRIRRRRW